VPALLLLLLLHLLLLQGIGYYKPLTQFSKGEYPGANQLQDDMAIIAGKLGYAPKTNGDSIATATGLTATINGATASSTAYGVVAQAGVPEFFKFQAAAGSSTIKTQLTPSFTNAIGGVDNRADLDMRVTVYDANGAVVATLDPPSFENAKTLEIAESAVTLPADGIYYVAVAGAGSGDPKSTGYSDYGEERWLATCWLPSFFASVLSFSVRVHGRMISYSLLCACLSTCHTPLDCVVYPADPLVLLLAAVFAAAAGSIGRFALSLTYPAPAGGPPVWSDPNPPTPSPPPSTPPSPSPSPVNVQNTMDVSLKVTQAYSRTLAAYTCTAVVTVKLTDGSPVPGATVVGRWGAVPASASYISTARGTTRASGAALGTFTAVSKALPATSNSCVFTVTAVRKTGLTLTSTRLPRTTAARRRSATSP
jgi:hypothetical protein